MISRHLAASLMPTASSSLRFPPAEPILKREQQPETVPFPPHPSPRLLAVAEIQPHFPDPGHAPPMALQKLPGNLVLGRVEHKQIVDGIIRPAKRQRSFGIRILRAHAVHEHVARRVAQGQVQWRDAEGYVGEQLRPRRQSFGGGVEGAVDAVRFGHVWMWLERTRGGGRQCRWSGRNPRLWRAFPSPAAAC